MPSDRENSTRLSPIVKELRQLIRKGVGCRVAALNRSGGRVRLIGLDLAPTKSGRLRGQGVRGSGRSGIGSSLIYATGSGLSAGRVGVGRLVRRLLNREGLRVRECRR